MGAPLSTSPSLHPIEVSRRFDRSRLQMPVTEDRCRKWARDSEEWIFRTYGEWIGKISYRTVIHVLSQGFKLHLTAASEVGMLWESSANNIHHNKHRTERERDNGIQCKWQQSSPSFRLKSPRASGSPNFTNRSALATYCQLLATDAEIDGRTESCCQATWTQVLYENWKKNLTIIV